MFQPNHFVPVLALTNLADVLAKIFKNESLQPAKKKPCKRDISSFFESANEETSSLANKPAKDDSSGSKRKSERRRQAERFFLTGKMTSLGLSMMKRKV